MKTAIYQPPNQTRAYHIPCIICGSNSYKNLFAIPPKTIVECTSCGHEYVNPVPVQHQKTCFFPADTIDQLGTEIDVNFLLKVLKRHGLMNCKLLDLGCGRGRISKELVKNGWQQQNLYLLDQSEQDLEIAKKACPQATFIEADIEAGFSFIDSFECIVMIEFLEHLIEPHKALQDAASALKQGGLLIVRALPNNRSFEAFVAQERWKMRRHEEHYHFFNLTTFSILAETLANMEIVEFGTFLQEGFRFYNTVRIAKDLGIISQMLPDESCLCYTGEVIRLGELGDRLLDKLVENLNVKIIVPNPFSKQPKQEKNSQDKPQEFKFIKFQDLRGKIRELLKDNNNQQEINKIWLMSRTCNSLFQGGQQREIQQLNPGNQGEFVFRDKSQYDYRILVLHPQDGATIMSHNSMPINNIYGDYGTYSGYKKALTKQCSDLNF